MSYNIYYALQTCTMSYTNRHIMQYKLWYNTTQSNCNIKCYPELTCIYNEYNTNGIGELIHLHCIIHIQLLSNSQIYKQFNPFNLHIHNQKHNVNYFLQI